MDFSIGVPGSASKRSFVEEQPCLGHTNRYDADVGDVHLGTQTFDGLLNFLPSRSGRVSLSITVDKQAVAGISFECELNSLLEALRNVTAPQEIGMDHIDTDASAMRMQQPLKDGDQHLTIGWPVGHEGETKCLHSGSSPK